MYGHRRGRPAGDRSAVRHHLDKLVPLLGQEAPARRPRLYLAPEEVATIRARLGLGDTGRMTLVHPGSTWPDKAWPEDRWPELLRGLHERGVDPIGVIAPPAEPGLAERIVEVAGVGAVALPPLDLRSLLALLGATSFYVGNDGGILHAAVALGVATLGLLGPTEPDIWFPYAEWGPYGVLHHCDAPGHDPEGRPLSRLRGLEVSRVLEAVDAVLAKRNELATAGREAQE